MYSSSSKGICILVGLMLLFVACGGDEEHEGKYGGMGGENKPEPVTLVEAIPVTHGQVSDTLIANAIVESESQADIYASATGIVLSVHKDEGDTVARGALLAIIDNIQLDASAERAQAELRRLEEQVESTKRLFAHGAASQRELEELEYQLATAHTNSREAAKTLGQTRLSAPFAGVVAARELRVGELTSSASRAFQIVDLEHLRVVASLPERDLSRTRAGQSAKLISAYDSDVWALGIVDRIAPVIDPTSGTFRVTIAVEEGQTALRPGQFVSVELVVDEHENVLVVPRPAVVYEDGRAVVYTIIKAPEEEDTDGDKEPESKAASWWPFATTAAAEDAEAEDEEKWVAKRIPIDRGLVDSEFVEVLDGLSEGEQVIIVGQSNLRDGARVRTADMAAEGDDEEGSKVEEEG